MKKIQKNFRISNNVKKRVQTAVNILQQFALDCDKETLEEIHIILEKGISIIGLSIIKKSIKL
jgi:hypothetical protein